MWVSNSRIALFSQGLAGSFRLPKSVSVTCEFGHSFQVLYSTGKPKTAAAAKERQICTKADRILDAPEYFDDFYLNLIDWSRNNHMAVALYDILYIWNAVSGSVPKKMGDPFCSIPERGLRFDSLNFFAHFIRSITELFDKSKDPSSSNAQNQEGVGDYISSVSWVKVRLYST